MLKTVMTEARGTQADEPAHEPREILDAMRRVAVVGASSTPGKPANYVPAYLQQQGVEVVPVNPNATEVLGVPAVQRLADVQGEVDVVVVFRPASEAVRITRDAIATGARAVWLQDGLVCEEAAAMARHAGLGFVMDRCIGVTHGELGLGPGPDGEAAACAVPPPPAAGMAGE